MNNNKISLIVESSEEDELVSLHTFSKNLLSYIDESLKSFGDSLKEGLKYAQKAARPLMKCFMHVLELIKKMFRSIKNNVTIRSTERDNMTMENSYIYEIGNPTNAPPDSEYRMVTEKGALYDLSILAFAALLFLLIVGIAIINKSIFLGFYTTVISSNPIFKFVVDQLLATISPIGIILYFNKKYKNFRKLFPKNKHHYS